MSRLAAFLLTLGIMCEFMGAVFWKGRKLFVQRNILLHLHDRDTLFRRPDDDDQRFTQLLGLALIAVGVPLVTVATVLWLL